MLLTTINFVVIIKYLQNSVTKILFLLLLSFLWIHIKHYYLFICYISFWRLFYKEKTSKITEIIYRPITINIKKNTALVKVINGCEKSKLIINWKSNMGFCKIYKSKIFIYSKNFATELDRIYVKNNINFSSKIYYKINNNLILKNKNLVISILLGIKNIDIYIKKIFLNTSTWHLICIGGLHINVVIKVLLILERILWEITKKIYFFRNLFIIIRLLFLCFYFYICEYHVPILRSFFTKILEIIFYILHIPYKFIVLYTIVFMGFVLYDYNYLWDIGFQMSFLAVFFLYNFSLRYKYSIINFMLQNFFLSILLSFFSFYLEGRWNILSFLANFFTAPLFYLVIISIWGGLLFSKCFYITNFSLYLIFKILNFFYYYGIYIYFFISLKFLNILILIMINIMLLIKIFVYKKYLYYNNRDIY